ncbi:MAG: DUF2007 domain-containing protein [Sumerlaeia bacterium]
MTPTSSVSDQPAPPREESWAVVDSYASPHQAEILAVLLNQRGIPSRVEESALSNLYPGAWNVGGSVRLLVRTRDLVRARDILGLETTLPRQARPSWKTVALLAVSLIVVFVALTLWGALQI